jgi:hypothetical protein
MSSLDSLFFYCSTLDYEDGVREAARGGRYKEGRGKKGKRHVNILNLKLMGTKSRMGRINKVTLQKGRS